jgi:nitrilase
MPVVDRLTVAAVQATPVFLDRDATVDRCAALVKEAAGNGARLMVFPETFVPTYPDWVWRVAAWDGPSQELFGRLREQAVEIPSPATKALGAAAKRAKAYVSVGISLRWRRARTSAAC